MFFAKDQKNPLGSLSPGTVQCVVPAALAASPLAYKNAKAEMKMNYI